MATHPFPKSVSGSQELKSLDPVSGAHTAGAPIIVLLQTNGQFQYF